MDITTLFYERSEHVSYVTTDFDKKIMSWVGGNAPAFFDDKIRIINAFKVEHFFYTTFLNPFDETEQMSIFIPKDYDIYLKYCYYPTCSIKIFSHPVTKQSNSDIYTHPYITPYSIIECPDFDDKIKHPQEYPFIKLGGNPDLLYKNSIDCEQNILSDGNIFLFQVDERGYPDHTAQGSSAAMGFAALYVYAQIQDTIQHPVVGFWQFVK